MTDDKIKKADNIKRCDKPDKKDKRNRPRKQIVNFFDYQLYRDLPEYHQQHQKPQNRPKKSDKKRLYLHGMRFINLNYKFIVDGRKLYKPQQLDPNVPVDTGDIMRILVPKGPSCPICLSEDLVAPRMITSCGHILCLTCLLSLLGSEVPVQMKRESKAIVEKYNDCPLCGSIIRKKDVKPVRIENVDERFEIPKIGDEVVLTLMTRHTGGIVPVPRYMNYGQATFPWVQLEQDFNDYLRFFKADLAYVMKMYEQEKSEIQQAYEVDRELYLDDGKFVTLALAAIDEDILRWTASFEDHTVDSALENTEGQTFFYYQTGFRSSATYILSPLDVKVLKASYNDDYAQLPDSVVAKVENIRYEELDEHAALSKYKYLSHLPHGTLLGFVECSWKSNEFLSPEAWKQHEPELLKRSKISAKKLKKEESDRLRAINESERRAREYIERENNPNQTEDSWNFSSLSDHLPIPLASISDHLPALSASAESESAQTKKSIWGTQVPQDDEDWESVEMIRRAREEIERQQAANPKKGKKKKYVLLSS